MSIPASDSSRALDLPPPYTLVTLRELDDASAHACSIAAAQGAGTLVWVRRLDVAECAVVLEPEMPLAQARRAFLVGMNALADALAAHAPPERPIEFGWPDATRVDGVLVGGGRLAWPEGCAEDATPRWLVFGGMLRTVAMRAGEPGLRPLLGSLDELGFEAIDSGAIVASFARYLMSAFHEWEETGFEAAAGRYLSRLAGAGGERDGACRIGEEGDLLMPSQDGRPERRNRLREALAVPSWLDAATGMPWL